jgi:hypothetical protein
LDCTENRLATFNISNNTAIDWLNISNIPSLNKVCVWEMPFPSDGVVSDTTGSPNVYFTMDCAGKN